MGSARILQGGEAAQAAEREAHERYCTALSACWCMRLRALAIAAWTGNRHGELQAQTWRAPRRATRQRRRR